MQYKTKEIMKANHQDIIYHLHGINGEVKSTLKTLIRDMLEEKEGKRVELNGTLFDVPKFIPLGLWRTPFASTMTMICVRAILQVQRTCFGLPIIFQVSNNHGKVQSHHRRLVAAFGLL